MPNGGTPMHMLLRPRRTGHYAVYCKGDALQVIGQDEAKKGWQWAAPVLELEPDEVRVLADFLRHWIPEGEQTDRGQVDVQFDY